MILLAMARAADLPEQCGCGARMSEEERGGLLVRHCLRCGAGETLSQAALQAAMSTRAARILGRRPLAA